MTDYALVGPLNEIKYVQSAPFGASKPGWRSLPVNGDQPAYDPASQIISGPTYTVNASDVTRSWAVRSMTAAELDATKDITISAMDKVAMQIAFNHENRLRALEGKAAITVAQFKTAIRALL